MQFRQERLEKLGGDLDRLRAIEDRLMHETWASNGYDLLPEVESVKILTPVI